MSAIIKNSNKVYNGFLKVFNVSIEETLPHTGEKINYNREYIERGDAVAIVIRDPKTDELAFTSQFRVGAAVKGVTENLKDIVAGMVDQGETLIETAIREAEEEVGAKNIKNIIQVAPTFYPSVGGCSETMTVFYGEADLSELPEYKGEDGEDEYIKVVKMKTDDALKNLSEFPTSASMVGLLWLSMKRSAGEL